MTGYSDEDPFYEGMSAVCKANHNGLTQTVDLINKYGDYLAQKTVLHFWGGCSK